MLRKDAEHDRGARDKGVQGVLLPKLGSWGLRAAQQLDNAARVRAKKERFARAFGQNLRLEPAERRDTAARQFSAAKRRAMDIARQCQLEPKFLIRNSVLAEVQEDVRAAGGLQPFDADAMRWMDSKVDDGVPEVSLAVLLVEPSVEK